MKFASRRYYSFAESALVAFPGQEYQPDGGYFYHRFFNR